MTSRAGTLTSTADFRRTYSEGRRIATGSVVAHVRLTQEVRPARVGISASRAIGGAVTRNRAKRRLREALRGISSELRPGTDVVLVATSGSGREEFQTLVDSLRESLHRTGGLRG